MIVFETFPSSRLTITFLKSPFTLVSFIFFLSDDLFLFVRPFSV